MANKKTKSDITVIIPVHELTDDTRNLFNNAIQSVADQVVKPHAVLIVVPSGSDVEKELSEHPFTGIKSITKIVSNSGPTDFASQMNLGVSECKSEWFTLLEYDDELSKNWLKNASEYKEVYTDVDMFLPIVVNVDPEGNFAGLINEAVWATEFSEVMGVLDNTALLAYNNFSFDGMVMSKEKYEDLGGIKPSMKLSFIYEFLLRLTNFSAKIMTIPRFGYKHINQRTGSLFSSYKDEIGPAEARWWMDLAKKESYHTNDRQIKYEKQS